MATHIERSWTLPADPTAVFAMMTDESFQRATGEAAGAVTVTATVTQEGPDTVITSARTMSTEGAPSAFKKLVGDQLDIVVQQRWGAAGADGSRTGTMHIEVRDKPVNFDGMCSLQPGGDGSQLQVAGDVRCSIPLMGGRIEGAVAPALTHGFKVEEKQGRAYLAG
ncbi:DUF2505 domain-containing protein [Branchiibius sp. NY16-3462-2]|uniref:DUF2505 domain-containing protein n=1 Tax=Branchiibius sp. NY16-3462-2 TaxID=1807500 RepID=UPI0007914314|nr:DUF2505 domain-containing protein [Branchiibius sp. NY16-3462-2]KYH45562.1 hypothetical protein AZH51_15980 [Branchiibius sp. NY16-3462-2]